MKRRFIQLVGVCLISSMCLVGCGNSNSETKKEATTTTEKKEVKKDDKTLIKELGDQLNTDVSKFSNGSKLELFGYQGTLTAEKYSNNNKIETIKWTITYDDDTSSDIIQKLNNYYNYNEDDPNKYDMYHWTPKDNSIKEITYFRNYETLAISFTATKGKIYNQKPYYTAYQSYTKIKNTGRYSVGTDENGDPAYEDTLTLIPMSQKDIKLDMYDGMMPPNAVYLKLTYYIEGSYIGQNGWKRYSPYVFYPAPKTYAEFKRKRAKVKSLFKTYQPSPNLYKHLKKLKTVKGELNIDDGLAAGCDFEITNLKKCAKELHISDECLGYIIAYFDANDCEITFSDDHNSCTIVDQNTYSDD